MKCGRSLPGSGSAPSSHQMTLRKPRKTDAILSRCPTQLWALLIPSWPSHENEQSRPRNRRGHCSGLLFLLDRCCGQKSISGPVTSSQQKGDQNRRQLQCEAQENTLSALTILNVQNALNTLYYHTEGTVSVGVWLYAEHHTNSAAWRRMAKPRSFKGASRKRGRGCGDHWDSNGCWSCVWPGLKASILWGSHMFSFHNKCEMFWYRATSTHNIYIYIYINWKPF